MISLFCLQESSLWKWKFFIFLIFIFSSLDYFSEKGYEKTYCFYNIFSKFSSICGHLPGFTIWIFLSKKMVPVWTQYSFFQISNFMTLFVSCSKLRIYIFCKVHRNVSKCVKNQFSRTTQWEIKAIWKFWKL